MSTFETMVATATSYPLVFGIFVGVMGLLIGSFLNVVICRLPDRMMWAWRRDAHAILAEDRPDMDEAPALASAETEPDDLVFTRSRCPKCGHRIGALENIPLLSWIVLRGKCKGCGTRISAQYPLVEAITGGLFFTAAMAFGPSVYLLAVLAAIGLIVAAAGIDWHHQLLPDQMVYPLLWIGLAVAAAGHSPTVDAGGAIAGALVGYLSLWSIYWLFKLVTGKEGMGYGDFKLLAALGAWTGAQSIISISLLACVMGVAVAVVNMRKGASKDTPFAFGPYLAAAGVVEILAAGWMWRLLGV